MARITDVFVSGTLGNVVLYRRMGINCSRIKRTGIKQTAATKIRSENFGIASRAAKTLRSGLHAVIPNPTGRSMQSRFSGAIAKWLCLSDVDTLPPCDAAPYISGFRFTTGDSFSERFRVPVTVSRSADNFITVSINAFVPALQVSAPTGSVFIDVVIAVAGCLLKTGMATGSETQRIQVSYNNNEIPAQEMKFNVPTSAGSLTVTAAWLQYYTMKNNGIVRAENAAFLPAGVINARYR